MCVMMRQAGALRKLKLAVAKAKDVGTLDIALELPAAEVLVDLVERRAVEESRQVPGQLALPLGWGKGMPT